MKEPTNISEVFLCSNEYCRQIEKQSGKKVSAGRALQQTLESRQNSGRKRSCYANSWGMSGPHRATEEHNRKKDSVTGGEGSRGKGLRHDQRIGWYLDYVQRLISNNGKHLCV